MYPFYDLSRVFHMLLMHMDRNNFFSYLLKNVTFL
jgi:hypothetical protein